MALSFSSILLTGLAIVLLIAGFIGCFLPVIPGPPLAWGGLLCAYFSSYNEISVLSLIITGVVALIITILDTVLPPIMTKRSGGSKAATTGSTIGIIVGLFLGPVGIILGPFIGALVGELIHTDGKFGKSMKSAWGAFAGFLCGTGMKMITVGFFIWWFVKSF